MFSKFKSFLFTIILSIFFCSCEKDLYDEIIVTKSKTTSEKISVKQILSEINNPVIEDIIKNELPKKIGLTEYRTSGEQYLEFLKIVKSNGFITYSFLTHLYTKDERYTQYFIITKDGNTEKAGYAKYIPKDSIEQFNVLDFTGNIQVLDIKNNVVAESQFINSTPQIANPNNNQGVNCTNSIQLVAHDCELEGNHPPGVACDDGVIRSYWEIVTVVTCQGGNIINYLAPPNSFMGAASGGGSVSFNQNVMNYLNTLDECQTGILLNSSLISYLDQQEGSQESITFVSNLLAAVGFNCENIENQKSMNDAIYAILTYFDEYGDTAETRDIALDFINSIFDNYIDPDTIDALPLDAPPSCESFNFTQAGTANWQRAAVQNIHFNMVLLSPNGIFISHVISYPNPILFEGPKILSVGNTEISSGLAAQLSARALNRAMKETVDKFGNKAVNEMIIERFFEEKLKHHMNYSYPGSRVQIHPQSYPTPTQYQTNLFGTGDCQ